jgi:Secretion system C-terminal sorting domain
LGVHEALNPALMTIKAAPNPMHYAAIFTIETGLLTINSTKNTVLTLYNAFGQLVKTQYFANETLVLQRDGLPQGCYFYKITTGETPVAQGKLLME